MSQHDCGQGVFGGSRFGFKQDTADYLAFDCLGFYGGYAVRYGHDLFGPFVGCVTKVGDFYLPTVGLDSGSDETAEKYNGKANDQKYNSNFVYLEIIFQTVLEIIHFRPPFKIRI